MISYKENPNLEYKVVTTVNGEKEYRINCKYIKTEYHIINKDCFFINKQWHRVNSGLIEFDYETKKWLIAETFDGRRGIVDFDKNNQPIVGKFSLNPYTNVKISSRALGGWAINSDILEKQGYIEFLSSGTWYNKKDLSHGDMISARTISSSKNYHDKGYNIEDNAAEFQMKKENYAKYPTKIAKEAYSYAKLLGDTTFGIEYETTEGFLPLHIENKVGIVSCRDGSISSAEYVTVPMQGAKGLQNVVEMCKELTERTNTDYSCSLHIHLGNVPLERAYICALYKLFYNIQDDLFKMFPYYKTDPRGLKHKNYCQKLEKLAIHDLKIKDKEGYDLYVRDTFRKIFMWLSEGVEPDDHFNRKQRKHPAKHKWDIPTRYSSLNFINAFFSNRNTLEFRMHENTTNSQKVLNWLFIINAIVRFAEDNTEKILTGECDYSLREVFAYYKNHFNTDKAIFLSEYLEAYYNERCEIFKKDKLREDYLSDGYTKKDKQYVFSYKGVSNLF